MACGDDIGTGLGLKIDALVPVHGYILDELEGIHEAGVVLRKVGGHLQGAVEGYVKAKVVADSMAHLSVLAGGGDGHILLEDAGRVVHGASLKTGER